MTESLKRYNHGLVERKWKKSWNEEGAKRCVPAVCALLIPKTTAELDLENARLMVLANFFAASLFEEKVSIAALGAQASWLESSSYLGLWAKDLGFGTYDFAVVPRDYAAPGQPNSLRVLASGRLLNGGPVSDFLPDFGGDALRIYFLYLGPPGRDYEFRWQGLVSAHRFVQRVWQLGSRAEEDALDQGAQERLLVLKSAVAARVLQKKPHTALAAIMGYIKGKQRLTKAEALVIAKLLRPFTPFLSAELLYLVAAL